MEEEQEAERVAKEEQEAAEAKREAEKVRITEEQTARREAERLRLEQVAEVARRARDEWTEAAHLKDMAAKSEILNIDITRFSGPMLARIVAARAAERDRLGIC